MSSERSCVVDLRLASRRDTPSPLPADSADGMEGMEVIPAGGIAKCGCANADVDAGAGADSGGASVKVGKKKTGSISAHLSE